MILRTIAKSRWTIKSRVQLKPNQCFFFPNFLHMWQSSHKRFNMNDKDPIEGFTLMVKIFKKNINFFKKLAKKIALCNKNLVKIPLSLGAT